MKKLLASILCASLLLSGCTGIGYSDKGGVSTVTVANTGWYLLNFIPLASGDPEEPGSFWPCFFRQTTTLENNVRMLDYAVTERNASGVRDVTTHSTEENILFILFKRYAIYTSAELTFDTADEDEKTADETDEKSDDGTDDGTDDEMYDGTEDDLP